MQLVHLALADFWTLARKPKYSIVINKRTPFAESVVPIFKYLSTVMNSVAFIGYVIYYICILIFVDLTLLLLGVKRAYLSPSLNMQNQWMVLVQHCWTRQIVFTLSPLGKLSDLSNTMQI